MSLTVTTITAAIGAGDRVMNVASATGFTPASSPTVNSSIAQIEEEFVRIESVATPGSGASAIGIVRGIMGTRAVPHALGTSLVVGLPATDFTSQRGSDWPLGTRFSSRFVGGLDMEQTFPYAPADLAGANTTLTPGQVLGGILLIDPGGAINLTLPTAALMVAAVPGATKGSTFEFLLRNTADAGETITVVAGTGGTMSGTATVAQSNSKLFLFRFTEIAVGLETYTCYSVGTFVH